MRARLLSLKFFPLNYPYQNKKKKQKKIQIQPRIELVEVHWILPLLSWLYLLLWPLHYHVHTKDAGKIYPYENHNLVPFLNKDTRIAPNGFFALLVPFIREN